VTGTGAAFNGGSNTGFNSGFNPNTGVGSGTSANVNNIPSMNSRNYFGARTGGAESPSPPGNPSRELPRTPGTLRAPGLNRDNLNTPAGNMATRPRAPAFNPSNNSGSTTTRGIER